MTATLLPDLSISLQQRRWACILDPMLALSDYGLPLVKQLGELMELWVVREFWNLLDHRSYYPQQSDELLTSPQLQRSPEFSQHVLRSLQEWERLRTLTDRNAWTIYFLADVLGESCLPGGTDPDLIWRWESLAQSLDTRLNRQETPFTLAVRDLAALAAARPACILTYRCPEETVTQLPPQICQTLDHWGIRSQKVQPTDAIAEIEREHLRQLLVHAGLAKFLWAGVHLAVLHLIVPSAATLSPHSEWSEDLSFAPLPEELENSPIEEPNLWADAQGFWYSVI
jgi:hypothetical protein